MSSLYPSLEDMKVDQMAHAQVAAVQQAQHAITSGDGTAAAAPAGGAVAFSGLYAGLGLEELMATAGLEIDMSPEALESHMGAETALAVRTQPGPIATITGTQNIGMKRAEIKQGIREVVVQRNSEGKIGLAVKSIDKGIFVSFVWRDSPAAMAGLRFGDQILVINDEAVAGWSTDKALKKLKKIDDKLVLAVRDRPFERTVTVVKDHSNHIGFLFKRGAITHLVKDTSAARNGLLINHQILEINGQSVVGLKDKDTLQIIQESPRSVTITCTPCFIFERLTSAISLSQLAKYADHGIPEV